MQKITTLFLFGIAVLLTLPLQAQFRTAMRTADKEYELHAYNLAAASYQQALSSRPNDLDALSKVADCFRMLNRMTQANQYYTQAVRDKDASANVKLQHAHVLKALGRYDEAKQWYLLYARDHDAVVGNHFAQSCDFANAQLSSPPVFQATASPANSTAADFGPAFAGQNQLVFNSARTDKGGTFDGQAKNYPFVAAVGAGGSLQEPFLLRNGYSNTAGNVGPVSYSPDGSKVIFTRNNFVDGTRMIPGSGMALILMIAEVNPSGGWVNARPLPFNGSDFSSGFGTFSPDGQAIYFASDRPEGYGGYDIYRADWQGNDWSKVPENLGTVINSLGDEITPYFDGASLYFASDWHHGMGSFDVFRTELVNGRPNSLYHMGNGINSSRDDYGFIYNPTTAMGYVVSNRIGGSGNEDIYWVKPAGSNLAIVVRSATDNTPVANATIDFTACGDQAYMTDINGRYVFTAASGLSCEVSITKEGYVPQRISLQITSTNQTGDIPVMLSKISDAYPGQIIDAQTRQPIANARVRAINRGTGLPTEVLTDFQGNYALAMQPYNTYDISISAQGYETLQFPLAMTDGANRNILGALSLLPGQNLPNTGGGGTAQPATAVGSGFAVQLASLSKAPGQEAFANIGDLGRVYSVQQANSYKVRMGVFQTRAEAERAQAALKQRGYPGAFIVTESGEGMNVGAPSTPSTPTPPAVSTGSTGPYYVQLGAYSTPRFFDANKAQGLGTLVQRQRGNLTLMLINAGSDLNTARSIQAQALSQGYNGAFVVMEAGSELTKVRQ